MHLGAAGAPPRMDKNKVARTTVWSFHLLNGLNSIKLVHHIITGRVDVVLNGEKVAGRDSKLIDAGGEWSVGAVLGAQRARRGPTDSPPPLLHLNPVLDARNTAVVKISLKSMTDFSDACTINGKSVEQFKADFIGDHCAWKFLLSASPSAARDGRRASSAGELPRLHTVSAAAHCRAAQTRAALTTPPPPALGQVLVDRRSLGIFVDGKMLRVGGTLSAKDGGSVTWDEDGHTCTLHMFPKMLRHLLHASYVSFVCEVDGVPVEACDLTDEYSALPQTLPPVS